MAGHPKAMLIKYGGHALADPSSLQTVVDELCRLRQAGVRLVLVHGGGPAIGRLLEAAGVESVFVGGHRKSDLETLRHVAMALRGEVNLDLVRRLNAQGERAVGLSGVDAGLVFATRRVHRENGREEDLGQVGDVARVDIHLIELLLEAGYLPVLAPLALGDDGLLYNVNADLFAGHLAAALGVDLYAVLTDVEGLRSDPGDAATRIPRLTLAESERLQGTAVRGGMIPKLESCRVALAGGVARACILDGTHPEGLGAALAGEDVRGTELVP